MPHRASPATRVYFIVRVSMLNILISYNSLLLYFVLSGSDVLKMNGVFILSNYIMYLTELRERGLAVRGGGKAAAHMCGG